MLKEAIQTISDQAVKAQGPQLLPSHGNHEERRLLPGGAVDVIEKAHPPRDHIVCDIDSLGAFVAQLEGVVIWHSDKEVVAVLNDAAYRDSRLTMPLPIHPTFKALADMEGEDYDQRELIDYLRLNLRAEVDAAVPTFIASLRDMKFVNNASGEAGIQHGRESMGKRIENSVTGGDKLPEDFILAVPLWLHLEAVVHVDCALIINTGEQTFRCGPKPGAIERAKVAGQKWLSSRLESACENAVVYFGSPDRR